LLSNKLILFVSMKQSILPILAVVLAFTACKSDEGGYLPTSAKPAETTTSPATQTSNNVNLNKPSQISTSVVPVSTAAPATTTVTTVTPRSGKGLNPPTDNPGHRGDIAVGAPLTSPVQSTAVQQPGTTVKPSATVTQSTPAGMNPPHGQPGHRCDISVGAPLNSKPTVQPAQPVQSAPAVETATKDSSAGGN